MKTIPDELKQHALDLQNISGLIYTGYPEEGNRYAQVSVKQIKRLKNLESKLRSFMRKELGDFWEMEFISSKQKSVQKEGDKLDEF